VPVYKPLILPNIEPSPDAAGVHAMRHIYRRAVIFQVYVLNGVDVAAMIDEMDAVHNLRLGRSFGLEFVSKFRERRDSRVSPIENCIRQTPASRRLRSEIRRLVLHSAIVIMGAWKTL
jgi:hypothetical protein